MNLSISIWRRLILCLLAVCIFTQTAGSRDPLDFKKETRLIRKLYLDTLKVPPSLSEMEWYMVYNHHPYETAVEEVLERRTSYGLPNIKDKKFYLSDEYMKREPELLNSWQRDMIIKYQSGDSRLSVDEASLKIIKTATVLAERDLLEGFDYLAECLMNRTLSVKESNSLLQIYKEKDGFGAVFNEIKTYRDFLYK